MKEQTLAGTLVLVNPEAENVKGESHAQVGVLTYARSESENYVSFINGGEAFYPAKQILMLKDKQQVADDLLHNGSAMELNDFKAMYKIMLLQDIGTPKSLSDALMIAQANPAIQDKVLQTIGNQNKMELNNAFTR